MSDGRPDRASGPSGAATVDGQSRSRGRVRQILVVFAAIFVISGAFTALHALLPGNPVDQLVGITPIVLVGLVVATVWLLYRQVRPG